MANLGKSGQSMRNSLRTELTQALQDCQRQLEILRGPPIQGNILWGGPTDHRREIALMEVEHRRLTDALASSGPRKAQNAHDVGLGDFVNVG
jgi:hypothetical protein